METTMNANPLEATVSGDAEHARIVLHGRIDRDGDATLAEASSRAVALGAPVVELDFSAVDYINSTGIALIVRLLAEARRDHREVRARGLTEHYREIFRITRLSDYVTLVDDATVAHLPVGVGGEEGSQDHV
jgi:anti-sigma B factor antagonist